MPLASGTRLGPYEVLAPLGAGGMGEVYAARDTRLGRTVAVKVLPPGAADDPDRRRRFEQEARAVSALNHPHICTVHDVGRQGDTDFLVMELLEGETLAGWLARMSRVKDASARLTAVLEYGPQIAEALAKAHRLGIVHRDLKPANVMLTRSGAKLLDFGLAKLRVPAVTPAESPSQPTQELLTAPGTILGTVPYMSPEQIEGREADARSDVFALGAVLYEMLAGTRAFDASSPAGVAAAVLGREPAPLSALQPPPPPPLDRLIARCLAKDPDERWQDARDLAYELRGIAAGGWAPTPRIPAPGRRRWPRAAAVALLLVGGGLVGAVLAVSWSSRARAVALPVTRLALPLAPAERLRTSPLDDQTGRQRPGQTAVALSADGRLLVFSGIAGGHQHLYARALDQLEARPIPDTADAASPFFSPDGAWVGFWANGALRKVALAGGPATTICDTAPIFGASWGANDTIVFGVQRGTGLQVVAAGGGTPRAVTTLDAARGEVSHRLPQWLPGGQAVVFTITRHFAPNWSRAEFAVQSLATGKKTILGRGADARYVPTVNLQAAGER